MKTTLISLGGISLLFQLVAGDRILFLLPIASKSHINVFDPLIRALGERGHEIVNLTPMKSANMPPTVKEVQIYSVERIFGELGNPFEMRQMGNMRAFMNGSFNSLKDACNDLLQTDTFQDLITNEKFDLVIVDILMNYCMAGAVHILQAPSIMVTTFAAPSFISSAIGNRLPPSFVADPFLSFTHKMDFVQRLSNLVLGTILQKITEYIYITPSEKMYKEHLPNGTSLPGVSEIVANTSMVFMNSNFVYTFPRPLLPDCIEIGGMHTRPAKPLPKDIDEFLSGSGEDGFIFFSLGSIVPAKVMPEKYRRVFVRVFSRLRQRVIWKFESESMPETVSSNVMLRKWLPQQDILGHPNIKLFMTHGGLLSTQEAIYHGVPLLGFPIFGDQDLNIRQAESAGYAKFFEILDLSEEKLENAIMEMLNSTMYSKKAKELSRLFKDVPETPLQKAVFWTEYVLRHKGAPHLRSAARELNFFQYYLLDVTFALILMALIATYIFYACMKMVFRMVCGRSKVTKRKVQ